MSISRMNTPDFVPVRTPTALQQKGVAFFEHFPGIPEIVLLEDDDGETFIEVLPFRWCIDLLLPLLMFFIEDLTEAEGEDGDSLLFVAVYSILRYCQLAPTSISSYFFISHQSNSLSERQLDYKGVHTLLSLLRRDEEYWACLKHRLTEIVDDKEECD